MLVADERTFIFNAVSNSGSPNSVQPEDFTATSEYSSLIYAGEDSQGNFVAVGGGAGTATGANSPGSAFGGPGMTSLKDPATGLLVSASSLSASVPLTRATPTVGVEISPGAPVFPEIGLVKISWLVPGYYCGTFRGVAAAAELSGIGFKSCLESLGFPGANTRNLNTPVDLGDSNIWLALARDQRYTPMMFMTDAVEYW